MMSRPEIRSIGLVMVIALVVVLGAWTPTRAQSGMHRHGPGGGDGEAGMMLPFLLRSAGLSPEQDAKRRRRERLYAVLDAAASFYGRYLWESQAGAEARLAADNDAFIVGQPARDDHLAAAQVHRLHRLDHRGRVRLCVRPDRRR